MIQVIFGHLKAGFSGLANKALCIAGCNNKILTVM
jgi:hypothetical protein